MNRKCDRNLIVHPFPAPTTWGWGLQTPVFHPGRCCQRPHAVGEGQVMHKATHA